MPKRPAVCFPKRTFPAELQREPRRPGPNGLKMIERTHFRLCRLSSSHLVSCDNVKPACPFCTGFGKWVVPANLPIAKFQTANGNQSPGACHSEGVGTEGVEDLRHFFVGQTQSQVSQTSDVIMESGEIRANLLCSWHFGTFWHKNQHNSS